MELLNWFMLGFFLLILYRMFIQEKSRTSAKTQGFIFTAATGATLTIGAGAIAMLMMTVAWAIPSLVGGLWKIFNPPVQTGPPMYVWIIIGFLVLIIVKVMSSSGQREAYYS